MSERLRSTTILKSFNVTPDDLIIELGLITASVYGKVWRYCQMKDGVCTASQTRLAEELCLSNRTIRYSLDELVQAGYLAVDRITGGTNRYRDTGIFSLNQELSFDRITTAPVAEGVGTERQGGRQEVPTKIVDKIQDKTVSEKTFEKHLSEPTSISNEKSESKPMGSGLTEKDYEQTRAFTQAVLESNEKAKTKSYTTLPEQYIPYAEAFVTATGIQYLKRYFSDWCSTFHDWIDLGYQPSDVASAVEQIIKDGKAGMLSRPGSVDWMLRSKIVQGKAGKRDYNPWQ